MLRRINFRNHGLVLFNPYIGPYQMLPLGVREDLEVIAMKRCSAFPKAPDLLEHHQLNPVHSLGESCSFEEIQSVYSTTPAGCATGHLLRQSYLSAEMQLVYSTAPADLATGHSLWKSYPSAEMQLVYSTVPADCIISHSLGESYLYIEMQSVYSGSQVTYWGSLNTLQRCSQCILQPQLTGPYRHSLGES